jgi:glycerate kinase
LEGAGAAGGLAGGLAALGATLVPGFELVAEHVDLERRLLDADVVVTGEGHLDVQSLDGKVVGSVATWAHDAGRSVVVIVGDADEDARRQLEPEATVLTLVERDGDERARTEPKGCIERAAHAALRPAAP